MYYNITHEQQEVLLRPLNGTRVAKRKQAGQQLSYLEAWDVKAHMIRVFGFAGWSWDVSEATLAFEDTVTSKSGGENWNVGYRVIGTLRVAGASYSEAAVGSATLPSRGDAHDMAIKTAESDAFKRAAINLGDQFGLGLYNGGQLVPVVRATLYGPEQYGVQAQALSEAVRELAVVPVTAVEGTESEEAPEAGEAPEIEPEAVPTRDSEAPVDEAAAAARAAVVEGYVEALRKAMSDGDVDAIISLKVTAKQDGVLDLVYEGKTMSKMFDLAVVHAGKVAAGKAALAEISEEVETDA